MPTNTTEKFKLMVGETTCSSWEHFISICGIDINILLT